jgi:hypothetical protein
MGNNFSKNLKIQQMKALKLAAFALTLGFFAASCGNSSTETTTTVDSPAVEAQPEVAPAPETAAPAPVDSPAAAAAPAADTAAKK